MMEINHGLRGLGSLTLTVMGGLWFGAAQSAAVEA